MSTTYICISWTAAYYTCCTTGIGDDFVWLVAPTTPEERVAKIVRRGTGFIYYVSREGVTGMQSTVSLSIGPMTALMRKYTDLPIAVGFGISNAAQAKQVAASAEAIVVGSAVVNRIAELGRSPEMVRTVGSFVRELATAVAEGHMRNEPPREKPPSMPMPCPTTLSAV